MAKVAKAARRSPTPDDCETFPEACAEIDRIDRKLITLVARRRKFLERAVELNTSTEPGTPIDRLLDVLRTRRDWARRAGVDPRIVELFFTLFAHQTMVDYLEGTALRPTRM